MALVLIGIAGLGLARLGSRSLALVLDARMGEQRLQQQWAVQSLQAQLLRDPETLFGDLAASFEEESLGWPHPASLRGGCMLGGVECEALLADEQAKPNLNLIQRRRPELVPGLLADAAHQAMATLPVQLRPQLDARSQRSGRFFANWGQLVDLRRLDDPHGLMSLAERLTCWGEPRLNISRASDEALETIARLALTGPEVRDLLVAREGFDGDLEDLFQLAEIPRRKALVLKRLVSDRSACYSLWLQTRSRDRIWLGVGVTHGDGNRNSGRQYYVWP